MKALKPKTASKVTYLYLGTQNNEHYYVLPDGRICGLDSEYFNDVFDCEDESEFTEQQKERANLQNLPFSFVKFLVGIQEKIRGIPGFWTEKEKDPENPATLGGPSKIWLQGMAEIEDELYRIEIHRSSTHQALKGFIDDLNTGLNPSIQKQGRSKLKVCLLDQENNNSTSEDLHIFAHRV